MKRWSYLVVATVFVAAGIFSIALAQVDKITINNKYPNKLQTPVILSHKAHADYIACTQCHHTWKKEERKTPPKCTECHKADEIGEQKLKSVYHKQCQDCHKDFKKQGKKTGPTAKCSGCHRSPSKTK